MGFVRSGGADRQSSPWAATAGAGLLAVAALYTYSLDGAEYGCRGADLCLNVVNFGPTATLLLLGLAGVSLVVAVGLRVLSWGRLAAAVSLVLGVAAVGYGLLWMRFWYTRGIGVAAILAALLLIGPVLVDLADRRVLDRAGH